MSDLLSRNVLVINQKAKLIELTDEYRIRDEEGNDIGYIREEGQSALKKAARLISDLDQFFTHRLAVYDSAGTKVVELLRPRKIMKSRVEITDGEGRPVGTIVQKNVFGKKRFALEGAGATHWARSTPRTGAPGTSRSRTQPEPRSGGSRRSGPACSRKASRPRTTTSSRSAARSPPVCA